MVALSVTRAEVESFDADPDVHPMARRILKFVRRTLAVLILLAALVWTADWLVLRYRIARDGDAYGAVEVHYRIALHMKNRRINQSSEKPRMVECVHSMFSHYDDLPCWYLERHPDQIEDLNGGQWHFFYGDE